jgi:hypothetical protein
MHKSGLNVFRQPPASSKTACSRAVDVDASVRRAACVDLDTGVRNLTCEGVGRARRCAMSATTSIGRSGSGKTSGLICAAAVAVCRHGISDVVSCSAARMMLSQQRCGWVSGMCQVYRGLEGLIAEGLPLRYNFCVWYVLAEPCTTRTARRRSAVQVVDSRSAQSSHAHTSVALKHTMNPSTITGSLIMYSNHII